jgi:hypothetical protein
MVEIVEVSKNRILLKIEEVSDINRDHPYPWDEDE